METQMQGQVCRTPKFLSFLLCQAASQVLLKKALLGDILAGGGAQSQIPGLRWASKLLPVIRPGSRLALENREEPRILVELAPKVRISSSNKHNFCQGPRHFLEPGSNSGPLLFRVYQQSRQSRPRPKSRRKGIS